MSTYPDLGPGTAIRAGFNPQGWDRCEIGGLVLPGRCKVTKASVEVKVDRKSKPGADVTRPTFHGVDPQALELELTTYTDQDRETWADQCGVLLPSGKQAPDPVKFDHPAVRHLLIDTVQVIKVHQMTPVEGKPGVATVRIELLQWTKAPKKGKSATKTPKTRKVTNNRNGANTASNPTPSARGVVGLGSVLAD
jgi:hypothetical protein